jgi:hypothetical protein
MPIQQHPSGFYFPASVYSRNDNDEDDLSQSSRQSTDTDTLFGGHLLQHQQHPGHSLQYSDDGSSACASSSARSRILDISATLDTWDSSIESDDNFSLLNTTDPSMNSSLEEEVDTSPHEGPFNSPISSCVTTAVLDSHVESLLLLDREKASVSVQVSHDADCLHQPSADCSQEESDQSFLQLSLNSETQLDYHRAMEDHDDNENEKPYYHYISEQESTPIHLMNHLVVERPNKHKKEQLSFIANLLRRLLSWCQWSTGPEQGGMSFFHQALDSRTPQNDMLSTLQLDTKETRELLQKMTKLVQLDSTDQSWYDSDNTATLNIPLVPLSNDAYILHYEAYVARSVHAFARELLVSPSTCRRGRSPPAS